MAVKYNKLFSLLKERKLKSREFLQQAKISGNVLTRMKRDEYISMESIEKICKMLNCNVDDILEFY